MTVTPKYKNKTQSYTEFIKYVNSTDNSIVFKQNLSKDIYRFLNWKKNQNINKNDALLYIRFLKKSGINRKEAEYIFSSLVEYFKFAGIDTKFDVNPLNNVYKRNNSLSLIKNKKIKKILIFLCVVLLSASLYYMVSL